MQIYHTANSKADQVQALTDLATKCTTVLTGMPHNPNHGVRTMADAIDKIVDLQAEIANEMQQLIVIKRDITDTIKNVENKDYQLILEEYYLCGKTWQAIAKELGYSVVHLYRIRDKAYQSVKIPKDDR